MSERPWLRVVRGEPAADELAAVTAVLVVRARPPARAERPARSAWSDPAHRLRITGRPGPDAWRRSALPS